ncbi:MAG: GNAT family N-acetyltransferase [Bauldia sp.]
MSIAIRPAAPGDQALILDLVRGLAEYERLLAEVEADEAALAGALFAANPRVFCDIAEVAGRSVGFALWFYNFSTFVGRHGIYLEDLFVLPAHRHLGVGKVLFRHLAARCVAENLGRLEWAVLDWNEPAIAFYRGRGARLLDDWTVGRLEGAALAALADDA